LSSLTKPPSSIRAGDVANKQSVVRVDDGRELAKLLQQPSVETELLIQEEFHGVGQGVEVLARNGRVLVEMQHRRIRETIDGGSTCREVVRPDANLSVAARRLENAETAAAATECVTAAAVLQHAAAEILDTASVAAARGVCRRKRRAPHDRCGTEPDDSGTSPAGVRTLRVCARRRDARRERRSKNGALVGREPCAARGARASARA